MVLQLVDEKYCFDEELLYHIRWKNNKKAHSMLQGCQLAELHDSSGSTLLHYSAKYGNAVMMEYFIERGCEINAKNNDEFTSLILAVKNRHLKIAKFLLEVGADIYPSKRSAGILLKEVIVWINLNSNHFHKDLLSFQQDLLKSIFKKINENLMTSEDQAIAELLFESDCPLHYVIRTLKITELTRYYLANGYPVDAHEPAMFGTLGPTLLCTAVSAGDLANVKVLLEHGADVNLQDYNKQNVLFYYDDRRDFNENEIEILRLLMKYGASLYLPDLRGCNVAELLLLGGQKEIVNVILPYADLMTKYGPNKDTFLHALIRNHKIKDFDSFEILLKQYFDINAVDGKGVTALHLAIKLERSAKIIDFMLKKGADISASCIKVTTLKALLTSSCERWDSFKEYSYSYESIELFFLHGGDVQKEFSMIKNTLNHRDFDKSNLAKVLIAHVALLEEGGQSFRQLFVPNVEARPVLTKLFEKYKLQIEDMKNIKVYESITMLNLVATDEKKLVHYAANDDLISNFEVLNQNSSRSGWYYYKYVKKRIARAVDVKKCQRKASLIIFDLTGIQQQLVLYKIIDYLRIQDINSLLFV